MKARLVWLAAAVSAAGWGQLPPIFPPELDPPFPVERPRPVETETDAERPAEPQTDERQIVVDNVDRWIVEGDEVELIGAVLLRWGAYTFRADRVMGNTRQRKFTLMGNVAITGQGQTTTGDELTIDFRARTWRFVNGETVLTPGFLGGNLLSEVFAQGELVEGSPDKTLLRGATATTCEYREPHYTLNARMADFEPERRLILRDVDVRILDRRLLRLPYVVIPLRGGRTRGVLPEIGQSEQDGLYVRSAPGYLLARNSWGNLRLDATQRRGFGLGFDHQYEFARAAGAASLYLLTSRVDGSQDLSGHWQNNQRFGSVQSLFRTDFRRATPAAFPANTSWNNVLNLTLDRPESSSRLAATFFRTETTGFTSQDSSVKLSDSRRLTRDFRWNIDLGLAGAESRSEFSNTRRNEADVRALFSYAQPRFDADLLVQRYVPIGSSENFFSGLERLPELTLRSDSGRLLGSGWDQRWFPFGVELGVGRFAEQNASRETERYLLNFTTSRNLRRDARFDVGYYSGLRQTFYGDGAAQYVLQTDVETRLRLGGRSGIQLRYNYLRPYGFSPFFFDRPGEYNLATAALEFQPSRSFRLQAQTGYDLLAENRNQEPWQLTSLNAIWEPAAWFRFRAAGSYDINRARFISARADLFWLAGATRIDASARYDPLRETFSNINLRVDALKWGRLRVQSLLLWDGYLKEFTARHFQFTYDLHCAEAIVRYLDTPYGFRSQRDVTFYIRIKAFPLFSRFGFGRQGEFLDPEGFAQPL